MCIAQSRLTLMTESSNALKTGARFSIIHRLRSFIFAWRGLRWLVHNEHNARVHLGATIAVIALGLFLKVAAAEWRWLFLAIGLVLSAEAFNTAVELLCDRIEPGFDPVIGRIKDVSAAAVLMLSLAAAGIGLLTLGPSLLTVVFGCAP